MGEYFRPIHWSGNAMLAVIENALDEALTHPQLAVPVSDFVELSVTFLPDEIFPPTGGRGCWRIASSALQPGPYLREHANEARNVAFDLITSEVFSGDFDRHSVIKFVDRVNAQAAELGARQRPSFLPDPAEIGDREAWEQHRREIEAMTARREAVTRADQFAAGGDPDDLDAAIHALNDVVAGSRRGDTGHLPLMHTYCQLLLQRYRLFRSEPDLREAISEMDIILRLTSESRGRPFAWGKETDGELASYLLTYSACLTAKYDVHCDVGELERAIRFAQSAIEACPQGEVDLSFDAHLQLSERLMDWFSFSHRSKDVNRAVRILESLTKKCHSGPRHIAAAMSLSRALGFRWEHTDDREDLDRAIEFARVATTDLTPASPHYPEWSSELAHRLFERASVAGATGDEDAALAVMHDVAETLASHDGTRWAADHGPAWMERLAAIDRHQAWHVAVRLGIAILAAATRLVDLYRYDGWKRKHVITSLRDQLQGVAALTALATLRTGGSATAALATLDPALTVIARDTVNRGLGSANPLIPGPEQLAEVLQRHATPMVWLFATNHGGAALKLGPDGMGAHILLPELTASRVALWEDVLRPPATPGGSSRAGVRAPEGIGAPADATVISLVDDLRAVLGVAASWLAGPAWVVPVGRLAAVPLAALGKRLAFHFSGGMHLVAVEAAIRAHTEGAVVALANVEPDDPDRRLDNAEDELAQLGRQFGDDAHCASGPEATLRFLMDQRSPTYLHMSVHGTPAPAIQLADGVLTPQMVSGDDFRAGFAGLTFVFSYVRLWFLNCCLAGLPDTTHASEEAVGFACAATLEGTAAVLCAQWAIHDAPAAEFSRCFYSALLRHGNPLDAADEARDALAKVSPSTAFAYHFYGH